MSKGLAFERDKRLVLEKIEEKIKDLKTGEFVISTQDFRHEDVFGNGWGFYTNDFDQLLLSAEKDLRGKIRLKSIIPIRRQRQKSEYDDLIIHEEDYVFEIFPTNKKSGKESNVLFLSKEKGLSMVVGGKEMSYRLKGRRYDVLSSLSKTFKKTSEIAKEIFGSEYDKKEKGFDQKIRVDIGEMREKIESVFGLSGTDLIEGDKGNGYRLGKQFKFIRK